MCFLAEGGSEWNPPQDSSALAGRKTAQPWSCSSASWCGCIYPAAKATWSSLPSVFGLNPELCPVLLGWFVFFFFPCNLGLVFWDDSARNAKRYGCFLALAESCHVLGATQRGDGTPLPALGWLGTLSLGRSQGFSVGPGSFQSKVQVQKTQHWNKPLVSCNVCIHLFDSFLFASWLLSIIRLFQLFSQ